MTPAIKRSTIAWADCSTVLISLGLPMNRAASTPNERVKIKKALEMVIGRIMPLQIILRTLGLQHGKRRRHSVRQRLRRKQRDPQTRRPLRRSELMALSPSISFPREREGRPSFWEPPSHALPDREETRPRR